MKSKTQLRSEINEVLASWNPIAVPEAIAFHEYESYIDPIIATGGDIQILTNYLKEMVTETMGLDFDYSNRQHKADLDEVVNSLRLLLTH